MFTTKGELYNNGIDENSIGEDLKTCNRASSSTELKKGTEGEEDICRICRCGQEEGRPLFHPCNCTGSIKFVHEDCLLKWLDHSFSSSKCELCGFSFRFTPVYEVGAPTILSFDELAKLCVVRLLKLMPMLLRFFLVFVAWGIVIPIATCVMFRILSLGKLDREGAYQLDFEIAMNGWAGFLYQLRVALDGGFYSSWGIGVCVAGGIFLSFLTLITVVDFVREHDMLTELMNDNNDNDNSDTENSFAEIETEIDTVENIDEYPEDDAIEEIIGENRNREVNNGEEAVNQNGNNVWEEDMDNGNLENVNVAMDELLGFRGPGLVLFHNLVWLLTFNGLYLCIALFAPTMVGAMTMALVAKAFEISTKIILGHGIEIFSPEDDAFLFRTLYTFRNARVVRELRSGNTMTRIMDTNSDDFRFGPFGGYVRILWAQNPLNHIPIDQICLASEKDSVERRLFFEEFHWIWLELCAVIIGYIVAACSLALIFYVFNTLQKFARSPASRRRCRSISRALSLMYRTLKVAIIVCVKMGILPVFLGVLLKRAGSDLIRLPMDQFSFVLCHPVFAVMSFGIAGVTHMLIMTVIVLELRDVLHPDILQGFIRSKDAEESLLRMVLEDSVFQHMRRMAVSCAIYSTLVFLFVYVPARVAMATPWHYALPYDVKLHYLVLEAHLPIELMVIHIGVLNFLDQGKDHIRWVIELWFSVVSHYLGLTSFILPVKVVPKVYAQQGFQPEDDPAHLLGAECKAEDVNDRGDDDGEGLRDSHETQQEIPPRHGTNEADAGNNDVATDELQPRVKPSFWVIRVTILSFLAWVCILLVVFAVLMVPFHTGRATAHLLQLPISHDPLIYSIGAIVLWRLFTAFFALKLHRAPKMIKNFILSAVQEWPLKGALMTATSRKKLEWMLFALLGVASPWLLGVMVQMALMLPSNHALFSPFLETDESDSWRFPKRLYSLYIALSGNAPQVSAFDVINNLAISTCLGDGNMNFDNAVSMAASMTINSGPIHDWLVGLVLTVALVSLLMIPEIMAVRPVLHTLHLRFSGCIDSIISEFDCHSMLQNFVLPFFRWQVVALVETIFMPAFADMLVRAISGHSIFNSMSIITICRKSIVVSLGVLALPTLYSEAEKAWLATHKTLRDERYLIGNRLHNIERTT